jgi:uncharacterized protein (DUF169 family)
MDYQPHSLVKELIMEPLRTDLSIYKKFNFERPPVGVKFLPDRPQGLEQLEGSMALCEMINEAQQSGAPFYITKDNEDCAGAMVLGMVEPMPMPGGGELGVRYGIFEQASANDKLIEESPKIAPGAINYVAFAPLDKLAFEPDLLFLLANTSQAEIVLRAMSYVTGEPDNPRRRLHLDVCLSLPERQGQLRSHRADLRPESEKDISGGVDAFLHTS